MAVWHAALNTTMKCFGHSNSRVKLDATTIFGATAPDNQDRADFNFMKSLRDKNISHDDNDWSNALPIAFLAERGHEPKIIDVYCMAYEMASGGPINVTRLRP